MPDPAYPAARAVAPLVRDHFERHLRTLAGQPDQPGAALPDEKTIAAIIDAAFWASLRREEGYVPRISLAFLPPEASSHPLRLAAPLPLHAMALARVAPAVERAGIHLGVWSLDRDEAGPSLFVWGTTRTLPSYCFVLEVVAPGVLVVKHQRGGDGGKFVNVAVLESDQVKMVDEHGSSLPDCPPLLESLLGFDAPRSWGTSVNLLVQLAVSMRAHGRGGSLLVVPPDGDDWRTSIMQPITYGLERPFSRLTELANDPADLQSRRRWREELSRTVEVVAGLTAVDGATVMRSTYELLAFGAKIIRREGARQVEQITVTEPIIGDVPVTMSPSQLGGTRHLSAAQFVQDQHDAVALVASQDGRFTVFAWSPCEQSVHAHRVETLLL